MNYGLLIIGPERITLYAIQGGEVRVQTEKDKLDLWRKPIVGSLGKVLCSPMAKCRLLNLNQKSWVLRTEMGGHISGAWEAGETVDHKGYWEVGSGTYSCL